MIQFYDGEIACGADAFADTLSHAAWTPLEGGTGVEGLRASLYSDSSAKPGQVRAIVAEANVVSEVWQVRLCATVVDNEGRVLTGTVGKVYQGLPSAATAKIQATRNVNQFARGNRMAFELDVHRGPWQPGDWVIDAAGAVWARSSDADAAADRAWAMPPATARRQRGDQLAVTVPEGRVSDDQVARPLHLLIRNGYPVQA